MMTPADIFDLIAKYGPGVIFAVLWWLERGERQDSQRELRQVSHDSTVAMLELKSVVSQLALLFKPASMGQ